MKKARSEARNSRRFVVTAAEREVADLLRDHALAASHAPRGGVVGEQEPDYQSKVGRQRWPPPGARTRS